jgi:nitroimidazol reductase NimA-like FMN-containing flavoprotein (pyridoxamine 5'-phosphate oxidase superfamily)
MRGPTPRSTVRRLPERACYDRETIYAILDEGLVCHMGFVLDGQPYVIPMIHARVADRLVIHGAAGGRMMRTLGDGVPLCVTVTLVDGLVLARSGFHSSMNYRSVVVLGRATEITDPPEKRRALDAIIEHVAPGRLARLRPPKEAEIKATRVLAIPLGEASAKIRTGPPKDDEEDYALRVWAGELPLRLQTLPPIPDPRLAPGIVPGPEVTGYERPGLDERRTSR